MLTSIYGRGWRIHENNFPQKKKWQSEVPAEARVICEACRSVPYFYYTTHVLFLANLKIIQEDERCYLFSAICTKCDTENFSWKLRIL